MDRHGFAKLARWVVPGSPLDALCLRLCGQKPPVCANRKPKQLAPCFVEMESWKPKTDSQPGASGQVLLPQCPAYIYTPLSSVSLSRQVIELESRSEMASVKKGPVSVVGAVEAFKDQAGLCRWSYGLRSLQQRAKSNMRSLSLSLSLSQAVTMSSSVSDWRSREQAEWSEESLRKVMFLSCWGPN